MRNVEADYMSTMKSLQDSNNNLASFNAREANEFSWLSQKDSQTFNAGEAQKNRLFQLEMSNTAHQREVRDLVRAGLNPVLSANNGAAVTSGAAASSGQASGTKADIDMQSAALYSQWKMNQANNAQALKIAKMNNKNALKMTEMNAAASMYGANASAAASRFAAMQAAGAAMYGAGLNYQLGQDRLTYDKEHPNNIYQLLGEIYSRLDGGDGILTNGYTEAKQTRESSPDNKKSGRGRN